MSGAVEGVLLPCPFCGGTDGDLVETFTRATDTLMIWAVECERCGAERASDASEYEAREFWNTRTTPPARSYADEDVARIIDPSAWADYDFWAGRLRGEGRWPDDADQCETMRETYQRRMPERVAPSLAKAAAIRLLSQGGKA